MRGQSGSIDSARVEFDDRRTAPAGPVHAHGRWQKWIIVHDRLAALGVSNESHAAFGRPNLHHAPFSSITKSRVDLRKTTNRAKVAKTKTEVM